MSTLTIPDNTQENRQAARQLQTTMAAARVGFTWFGTRKTLTPEQKAEAADTFGAEGEFVSAGKKLLDTRNPRFKAVTAVRNQIGEYWRSISLPFPEPGLRLIQQERLDEFQEKMTGFKRELDAAVRDLDRHFDAMKSAARDRLGRLFNSNDYPSTLIGLFDVSWDFPSVQAPEYLRELNPALYREECQRVQARFEEAVRLAESAFVDELAKLVSHLTERLSGQEDGRPKVFRDSAVGNLRAFFDQFMQATLDGMLVDRPRRRIVRPSANGASHEPRD
ncbi:MAG: hypothetical protein K8T89_23965 [Planctomycetes bacterium]|nr:hypothetical protein [Planctomycetota bacterium]